MNKYIKNGITLLLVSLFSILPNTLAADDQLKDKKIKPQQYLSTKTVFSIFAAQGLLQQGLLKLFSGEEKSYLLEDYAIANELVGAGNKIIQAGLHASLLKLLPFKSIKSPSGRILLFNSLQLFKILEWMLKCGLHNNRAAFRRGFVAHIIGTVIGNYMAYRNYKKQQTEKA